jgi:hypothetical protein
LLFKADRPRAIDRHIDYFGGAGSRAGMPFESTDHFAEILRALRAS